MEIEYNENKKAIQIKDGLKTPYLLVKISAPAKLCLVASNAMFKNIKQKLYICYIQQYGNHGFRSRFKVDTSRAG